jgi:hypothetical protein
MKKYIGRLIRIKFRDIDPINGILLDYNDDWILVKSNPVDYVLDGYFVIGNKNLKTIEYGDNEKWKEKVIKLKGIGTPNKARIPLDNFDRIIKTLTKKYKVFTIYKKENDVCWLGRLKSIDDTVLTIDDLNPKGKWDGQKKFKIKDIRVIEFDTDYINSLKRVSKRVEQKRAVANKMLLQ